MRWIWIERRDYILRCCSGVGALKNGVWAAVVLLFMVDMNA
jgi:hypothetical protein